MACELLWSVSGSSSAAELAAVLPLRVLILFCAYSVVLHAATLPQFETVLLLRFFDILVTRYIVLLQ